MIIEPKIRGFLCTTAHPDGCSASVAEQIRHVQKGGAVPGGPKRALILGCSTGYGLASRIAAAFSNGAGRGAGTLGVGFERPAERDRTASPGWYNNVAFDAAAREAGLYAKTLNGDAFSNEMKAEVVALLKKELGPVDLFVYSLAAPRRTHPVTGIQYRSTLKPIGAPYTNKTLDFNSGVVSEVTLDAATPEEVEHDALDAQLGDAHEGAVTVRVDHDVERPREQGIEQPAHGRHAGVEAHGHVRAGAVVAVDLVDELEERGRDHDSVGDVLAHRILGRDAAQRQLGVAAHGREQVAHVMRDRAQRLRAQLHGVEHSEDNDFDAGILSRWTPRAAPTR
jgi:hypothetical protein